MRGGIGWFSLVHWSRLCAKARWEVRQDANFVTNRICERRKVVVPFFSNMLWGSNDQKRSKNVDDSIFLVDTD